MGLLLIKTLSINIFGEVSLCASMKARELINQRLKRERTSRRHLLPKQSTLTFAAIA